jgi:hypothetical protein
LQSAITFEFVAAEPLTAAEIKCAGGCWAQCSIKWPVSALAEIVPIPRRASVLRSRPADALPRRLLGNSQRRADAGHAHLLEEPENDRPAIGLGQIQDGIVQTDGNFRPSVGRRAAAVVLIAHDLRGLCFVVSPPCFTPQGVGGGKTGDAQQPAGQMIAMPQRGRMPRQKQERRLRDILGKMPVANPANRRGINQAGISMHQLRERLRRSAGGEVIQQFVVGLVLSHPHQYVQPREKCDGKNLD